MCAEALGWALQYPPGFSKARMRRQTHGRQWVHGQDAAGQAAVQRGREDSAGVSPAEVETRHRARGWICSSC